MSQKNLREMLEQHSMPAAPELVRPEGERLHCYSCANHCRIAEGKAGICMVRMNRGGQLRVPGHYVAGLNVDPIEKKPFFHVFPGRNALSFGMLGCNYRCPFCQNWISSQVLRDDESYGTPRPISPERLVEIAVEEGAPVMVSTYNEPLITSDWAFQVFEKAREKGVVCGYVSNGHATPEVLAYLRPVMQLYKVDLKCFTEEGYHQVGGRLQVVLDTIIRLKELGYWVEVVTLVIPTFNDSSDELSQMASFLAGVSPDIPWHVTAFHPDYRMVDPRPTRPADLERAYEIGREAGLRYVYAGNLPGSVGDRENTSCPQCGDLLIDRHGYIILKNRMQGNRCPKCNTAIPGIWETAPATEAEHLHTAPKEQTPE